MRAWIRQHQLLTFFLLAYALSWAYWVPMVVMGLRIAPGSSTTHFPGVLGPAIAAFLTPLLAGDYAAIKALARRLTHITEPRWLFWLCGLSPLLFLLVALLIANASDAGMPALGDFSRYSGLPARPGGSSVAAPSSARSRRGLACRHPTRLQSATRRAGTAAG